MLINPTNPETQHPWGDADTPFLEFGGEPPIRLLVEAFYDIIDAEFSELREMHPSNDAQSRTNLYEYLVGWTGGPQLYAERKGHPRIRARHLPFTIGQQLATDWLTAMRKALSQTEVTEPLRTFLDERLTQLATHVINA